MFRRTTGTRDVPAVHGGGPRWKSFEYNTLLSVEPFREERIMDANRYFTAMHNAMSSRLPGAQLLAAVRLQDLCGNDAYLEVRRMPGEHCATVCYSTMGRRGLNFQLFRKGWMLCHNESGQLTGQFPAKAESLLEDTDFHACCREDRLDAARTDRMVQELEGNEGQKHLEEYADSRTERGKCLLHEICAQFGFDSLSYQSLDGLLEAIGLDRDKVCTYCWTGKE